MKLNFSNDKSLYLQIAESIEDDILSGALEAESQIPSTNQMAVLFAINPATAGKGISKLTEDGIIYKKRGIGMFVAEDARGCIIKKRKNVFYENFVVTLLHEANNLGISREELINMINAGGNIHE